VSGSSIAVKKASAVTGPTPGTLMSRLHNRMAFCHCLQLFVHDINLPVDCAVHIQQWW